MPVQVHDEKKKIITVLADSVFIKCAILGK